MISAKEPGRRVRSLGSSMLAVMSTRREVSSADSATWTTLAVNSRLSSRTRKVACWPGLIRAASRSGTRNRRRSGSRRTSVARTVPVWTYCPVWTVRVWMMPGDGGLDEGVAEVELGLVEGRPGLGDFGGGGQDLGPPGLDLFARDEAGVLGLDRLAPLEAGFGVGLGGLGLLERGLGRFDGQPVALGLDLDQDLAGRGVLTFGEPDAVDGAGDAGRDLDLLEGLDGADGRDGVDEGPDRDLLHVDGELDASPAALRGGRRGAVFFLQAPATRR